MLSDMMIRTRFLWLRRVSRTNESVIMARYNIRYNNWYVFSKWRNFCILSPPPGTLYWRHLPLSVQYRYPRRKPTDHAGFQEDMTDRLLQIQKSPERRRMLTVQHNKNVTTKWVWYLPFCPDDVPLSSGAWHFFFLFSHSGTPSPDRLDYGRIFRVLLDLCSGDFAYAPWPCCWLHNNILPARYSRWMLRRKDALAVWSKATGVKGIFRGQFNWPAHFGWLPVLSHWGRYPDKNDALCLPTPLMPLPLTGIFFPWYTW